MRMDSPLSKMVKVLIRFQCNKSLVCNKLNEDDSAVISALPSHPAIYHMFILATAITYIVVDEIKVVSWCDSHGPAPTLGHLGVGLV